ncbi:Protein spinster [Armadillidium nasatum]|uniref:Protein spinster n=1 Tax=Armadillidium nasatum TaxID=96803 RepID=A0A5N5SMC2_9CRUS|nr:Protein spinster [Armadillidium nasatum]
MVMAPLYGYLGDRFNRRVLMAVGVFLWSLTTLLGSFMQTYHWFLVMRCFVGIGEASYSTIAPTLISDIFVSNLRSKISGLGYIIGSEVADLAERFLPPAESADAWRWGLRVTPVMGLVAVLLIIFVLKEPPRGVSEGAQHLKPTSFISDIKHLVSNRTYIFTTLGFTCVTYVAGALAWWGPNYVELGVAIQPKPNVQQGNVSFIFGVIAMIAGLVGVPLGSFTGQKFRGSTLFFLHEDHQLKHFRSSFLTPLVADAFKPLLNGTQPGSSLIFGTISSTESYSDVNNTISSTVFSSKYVEFKSLQYSLIICVVVELLAAIFFFWAAVHIAKDKEKCDRTIAERNETIIMEDIPSPNSSSQKDSKLSVKYINESKTQTNPLPNSPMKEIKNDSKIIHINCQNGFSGYVPAIVYDTVPITDKQTVIVHL